MQHVASSQEYVGQSNLSRQLFWLAYADSKVG